LWDKELLSVRNVQGHCRGRANSPLLLTHLVCIDNNVLPQACHIYSIVPALVDGELQAARGQQVVDFLIVQLGCGKTQGSKDRE